MPDDLKGLVLQLLEDVVALKAENAALREEIARLKGLKGLPKLKPSGMEKATEPGARGTQGGPPGWQDRPACDRRGAGAQGGRSPRLAVQGIRDLRGPGADPASSRDPLPP